MGRVHFQEGEIEHHQGHVKQDNLPLDVLHFPSNSNLTLHLGIIAFNHSYSVKFGIKSSVPLKIARQYQHSQKVVTISTNSSLEELENQEPNYFGFNFYFQAIEVGDVQGSFFLETIEENPKQVEIGYVGHVMPRSKGTPLLKDGISCIGILMETDWETDKELQQN